MSGPRTKRVVGVRLDPEMIKALKAVAAEYRVSLSEALRMVAEWGLESAGKAS